MTAPTELDERAIDVAIESLGIEFLRELRAIAWFCDCGADGKMALVPSDRRHWYEPGGKMEPLASTGCVRLLGPSYCATVRQHRPSIRVEQFGRRVLVRARAMRLPIEIDDDQPCALPASEAGWPEREEGVDEVILPYAKFISARPELLSLLYDIDMLPEQCVTRVGAVRLAGLCEVWRRGEDGSLPSAPDRRPA